MKRMIISLLLTAIVLTSAAQQSSSVTKFLSFRCQIEGQDITLPCRWSDLERLGWSFSNMEDGEATVISTSNLILRDYTNVEVLSPNKLGAKMLFCNLSDKEATRKEAMVYGIFYLCPVSQVIAYDFKIEGRIVGGKSKESDVIDVYGKAKLEEYYNMHKGLQYSGDQSDNEITIVVTKTATDSIPKGTVICFVALANQELARLITESGNIISDEQAKIESKRYFYDQNIAKYTKKIQQAQADSSLSEEIPHAKWALAINYYNMGDYSTAFEWMVQSAEAGYDEAQFSVGAMYLFVDGVEIDTKSAVLWLEKAAQQGHIISMRTLATHYDTGSYEDRDSKKVFEWSLKAAQGGYEPFYVVIGDYYRYGHGVSGVKEDHKQSFFWYEKAAKAGDKVGIYHLSSMYYYGLGVKQNYKKSFELLLKADQARYYVQQALGEHYYYGRGVEKDIDKALVHFNNFIECKEEDFDRLLTKEFKEAEEIVKKHQK